jgi:hypothetical protein
MQYRINVARSTGPNWNNTGLDYRYYFHIETDLVHLALEDLVVKLRNQWPDPEYKIEVDRYRMYRETVDI